MPKTAAGYLVVALMWAGLGAFGVVFIGQPEVNTNRFTLALMVWGASVFWPFLIALFVDSFGSRRWRGQFAKVFFWLTLPMAPPMWVLVFA